MNKNNFAAIGTIFVLSLLFLLPMLNPQVQSDETKTTANSEPLDAFELGRYQYCGQDSDCVVATNGCCDCANGGEDVAVAKERLEDFKSRFNCLKTPCTKKAAVPPCGSGLVSCIEHKCKYVPRQKVESRT